MDERIQKYEEQNEKDPEQALRQSWQRSVQDAPTRTSWTS